MIYGSGALWFIVMQYHFAHGDECKKTIHKQSPEIVLVIVCGVHDFVEAFDVNLMIVESI